MITPQERLALAARALVGTPFRLHGRSPETGVDCVGLLGCALGAIGRPAALPTGYALRNATIARHLACFAGAGFRQVGGADPVAVGDVLLTRPGPAQHHLMIATGPDAFVHAHAGLRRVAEWHGAPADPLHSRWRLAG
ncbi:hypothetical protein EYB45_03965 [Erythrobacteraceae bacterium CFH 75059]|uniref:C40 family peptidase n=1 Tax=Qipengyuania thermophila TaxID=2509361 RepID=UPI00101F9C75|nr:C40 family peptidase [Qipengyuania thermophila]TCD06840.1 hypothetical protein EYB45_03965 [Erythrobacteraceae bacterium CFH 75059]